MLSHRDRNGKGSAASAGWQSVSVVIPAYNAEGLICRAIDSALGQTLPPCEVIVVDDGSQDGTREVTQSYGPPVRLIAQANAGPSAARNHGARESRGDWIAFLDADDAWLPTKLERQAREMTSDVVLVSAHTTNMSALMKHAGVVTFESLWKQNCFATSTVVVRKSAFEAEQGFVEDRCLIGAEDYNLWLRLVHAGLRCVCVPEVLSEYTPAKGSLTSRIEMVLEGELENVRRLASLWNLPPAMVRAKQAALYEEYALALLHARDLPAARRVFRTGARRHHRCRLAAGWLATFFPESILNLKRRAVQG